MVSHNDDTGDDRSSGELIHTEASVVVTDVFGLGKVANSLAGKAIASALGSIIETLTGPAKTLLQGMATNTVEAGGITSRARAEARAMLIADEAQRELTQRAVRRLALTETVKQQNLESTISAAIDIADKESRDAPGATIEPGWMLKWVEGAQDATEDDVRKVWARVLATKAAGKEKVRTVSLALLPQLDKEISEAFEEFCKVVMFYGMFPFHGQARFDRASVASSLDILQELGFIKSQTYTQFTLRRFDLKLGSGKIRFTMVHSAFAFTVRGFEIACALFNGPRFSSPFPTPEQEMAELSELVRKLVEEGPAPLLLTLKDAKQEPIPALSFLVDKKNTSPVSIPQETLALLDDTQRKLFDRLALVVDLKPLK